jgi:LasA protease
MRPSRIGALSLVLLGVSACNAPSQPPTTDRVVGPWTAVLSGKEAGASEPLSSPAPPTPTLAPLAWLPATRVPGATYASPTPDAQRASPPVRTDSELYVVQPGDNLSLIAGSYGVSPTLILQTNGLLNPNFLPVWYTLTIPPPRLRPPGPSFKILPDSGVVYAPPSVLSTVEADVAAQSGYLGFYAEDVDGRLLTGAQIVQLVSQQYSIAPRLLLALLEHQGGWLSNRSPGKQERMYPLGYVSAEHTGLFSQLSWAANSLNFGYYRWRAGWAGPFPLPDGSSVPAGPGINAGTAAVQMFFASLLPYDAWRAAVEPGGFDLTYAGLFGDPFFLSVDPLVPDNLQQPELRLPFEDGTVWWFTGGPHGAWGSGAGWAALDFAPPGNALGCITSEEWVTASADGLVLRSDTGEVVVDLDQDGYEQTGWVLLYMHIEARDRVPVGTMLKAGDRIGHPSCEGGVSDATHLHFARKYNGEWIPADGSLPFNLDGWISAGTGREYDGLLERGDVGLEACSCRGENNQVGR